VLYIFHVSNDKICINHLEEERYIYILIIMICIKVRFGH
jgi:hypothetical protein